ncbi:MAG TPA: NAD(+)/NADH kinase [Acidobacteriota bacterium]|nr:NAD(+)/NADH kinase [Acidobacteriota bacterium]
MRFGLIANLRRTGAREAINSFIDWAHQNKQELVLCEELRTAVPEYPRICPRDQLVTEVDILVSMGGDGTILATARLVGAAGTPLLGINLGSLGFLTQQTPQQLIPALDAIVSDKYTIEERMLLKAELQNTGQPSAPYALNDVVVDNGPVSRVISINLRVNGEDVVTYIADGLILSTPTGSTAYSLAVGGPIVTPGLDAIIAAPIAPFSLTTRPMIFSGDDVLEVSIASDRRAAILTLDGQVSLSLKDSQSVRISRAEFRTRFIVFAGNSYYKLLRSKLNWGMPPNF